MMFVDEYLSYSSIVALTKLSDLDYIYKNLSTENRAFFLIPREVE